MGYHTCNGVPGKFVPHDNYDHMTIISRNRQDPVSLNIIRFFFIRKAKFFCLVKWCSVGLVRFILVMK